MIGLRTYAVALVLVAAMLGAPSAAADDARPAATFSDSVGVNVHLYYTDTVYADWRAVHGRLRDLGVRHVRDQLVLGRPDFYERLAALAADGIGIDLIIDPRRGPVDLLLDQAARLPGIESLEGANELDLAGLPDWPAALRAHQLLLRLHSLANIPLSDTPVVGPSFGRPRESPRAVGPLGDLVDYGNMHWYSGGQAPASTLAEAMESAREASGQRPIFATETGYHNALADYRGHPGVSERAAGLYMPALLLEYFRRGVQRTFLYELVDERREPTGRDRQHHFGLLRSDFSPKPAYLAVRRLLQLLDDRPATFAPRPLDFALAGETSRVRHVLLQKSDGAWWLALWHDAAVWDPVAGVDLFPPAATVQLTVPQTAARLDVYDPAISLEPRASVTAARSLQLSVPVSGVLVRIAPPDAASRPARGPLR